MRFAHLSRIKSQVFGNLVELHLERITRLWCSVPALWSARRLVCENAQPIEFVTRHFVSHRLQRARIESARDAIAAVSAAIKKRFEMHRGDRAVFLHPGLYVHQHGMATAMAVEDFFARQRALNRATGDHGELADDDFVVERIALAAK